MSLMGRRFQKYVEDTIGARPKLRTCVRVLIDHPRNGQHAGEWFPRALEEAKGDLLLSASSKKAREEREAAVKDARTEVLLAAVALVESKRPIGWSAEKHRSQPQVNCASDEQIRLAKAVLEYLHRGEMVSGKIPLGGKRQQKGASDDMPKKKEDGS